MWVDNPLDHGDIMINRGDSSPTKSPANGYRDLNHFHGDFTARDGRMMGTLSFRFVPKSVDFQQLVIAKEEWNDDKLCDFEVPHFQIPKVKKISVVEAQPGGWTNRFTVPAVQISPNSRISVMGWKLKPQVRKISCVLPNNSNHSNWIKSWQKNMWLFLGHSFPAPHPQVALLWECPCSVSTSKRSVGPRASTLGWWMLVDALAQTNSEHHSIPWPILKASCPPAC